MARNEAIEERVKTLVAEMLAEEEALDQLGSINDIEDAMVRIGDLVAREFGVQALAAQTRPLSENPCCPECGHAGEHLGERLLHAERQFVGLDSRVERRVAGVLGGAQPVQPADQAEAGLLLLGAQVSVVIALVDGVRRVDS